MLDIDSIHKRADSETETSYPLRVTERLETPLDEVPAEHPDTTDTETPTSLDPDVIEECPAQESADPGQVSMIPISQIRVVNPRERNKRKFRDIVTNIGDIGIKKPITVRPRGNGKYDLICGQGRLEAMTLLGQTEVPAIVRDVSEEDGLVMSLVENIARKRPNTMETIHALVELRDKGYSYSEIGAKTGMSAHYVGEFLYLYDHGEEKLLSAVERGKITLHAAVIIARSEHADVQRALTEALEQKLLSVAELQRARSLADNRRLSGKSMYRRTEGGRCQAVTPESIVRTFRREQEKQMKAIKKAELCEARLIFVVSALRSLFSDDNFVNLLRAETLDTVPEYLAEQIKRGGNSSD